MNFYCITNSFNHCHGSCYKYPPSKKWVYNQVPKDNSPVIYTDQLVFNGISNSSPNKFGWLCESSSIIEDCLLSVKKNISILEKTFIRIFVNDKSLLELSPVFEYVYPGSNMPWLEKMEIANKTKLVSMILSNKKTTEGHILRHKISEKYQDKIDKYGHGVGKQIEKKEQGMVDYMFSFCIENAKYDLYFTEKITDAISCGTIPIYWGSREIGTVFNEKGIIFLDDMKELEILNESLYEEMLPYAKENLEILKKMKPSDTIIQERMMELSS